MDDKRLVGDHARLFGSYPGKRIGVRTHAMSLFGWIVMVFAIVVAVSIGLGCAVLIGGLRAILGKSRHSIEDEEPISVAVHSDRPLLDKRRVGSR